MYASTGKQDQRIMRLVGMPLCRRTELHLNLNGLGHLAASE
jgi:hypothetical protein